MTKVDYDLTEDDFMRYAQYHFQRSDDAKATYRRTLTIGLLALVVYAVGIKDDPNFGLHVPVQYVARIVSVIVVFLVSVTIYMKIARPMLVRGWLRSAAKRSLGHTVLELQDDGVHVGNVEGQGRLAWEACRGVVEESEHIYIIMGPLRALVVPKRAFGDDASASAFVAEARTRLTNAHVAKTRKA